MATRGKEVAIWLAAGLTAAAALWWLWSRRRPVGDEA